MRQMDPIAEMAVISTLDQGSEAELLVAREIVGQNVASVRTSSSATDGVRLLRAPSTSKTSKGPTRKMNINRMRLPAMLAFAAFLAFLHTVLTPSEIDASSPLELATRTPADQLKQTDDGNTVNIESYRSLPCRPSKIEEAELDELAATGVLAREQIGPLAGLGGGCNSIDGGNFLRQHVGEACDTASYNRLGYTFPCKWYALADSPGNKKAPYGLALGWYGPLDHNGGRNKIINTFKSKGKYLTGIDLRLQLNVAKTKFPLVAGYKLFDTSKTATFKGINQSESTRRCRLEPTILPTYEFGSKMECARFKEEQPASAETLWIMKKGGLGFRTRGNARGSGGEGMEVTTRGIAQERCGQGFSELAVKYAASVTSFPARSRMTGIIVRPPQMVKSSKLYEITAHNYRCYACNYRRVLKPFQSGFLTTINLASSLGIRIFQRREAFAQGHLSYDWYLLLRISLVRFTSEPTWILAIDRSYSICFLSIAGVEAMFIFFRFWPDAIPASE